MPLKKTSQRKHPRKPVSVAVAKNVITRVKKSQMKKNMDTYSLKSTITCLSIPSQGVTASNYVYQSFPLLLASNPYGVTNASEFVLFSKLYDQVRVNSMTIKVTPKANVLSQAEAQYDSNMTLTGDNVVHTVIDRDSDAPWNISALTKYSSYKKFNMKRPFQRTYKISYPKGVWLDCSNIYEDETLLKRLGALGGMTLYAENLPEDKGEVINEPWAQIEITYHSVFRGKTSAALSTTEDGEVCVRPHSLATTIPAKSVMIVTGGTFINKRLISTDEDGIVTTDENDFSTP